MGTHPKDSTDPITVTALLTATRFQLPFWPHGRLKEEETQAPKAQEKEEEARGDTQEGQA